MITLLKKIIAKYSYFRLILNIEIGIELLSFRT